MRVAEPSRWTVVLDGIGHQATPGRRVALTLAHLALACLAGVAFLAQVWQLARLI